MRRTTLRRRVVLLSVSVAVVAAAAVALATGSATGAQASSVTTTPMGPYTPTFVGSAAAGCANTGCSLLSGPVTASSTASSALSRHPRTARGGGASRAYALRAPNFHRHRAVAVQSPAAPTSSPMIPTVDCPGAGCDSISTSSGGAVGVKGLKAVDSAENTTNIYKDVEPPDQGLCAGAGYVVEANNIGEILIFGPSLDRNSVPISLDDVMGLTSKGWSSGGDPSCLYDPSNGGHWFFTEIVSASSESSGGAFTGCFSAQAKACYEGIAVSKGSSPYGPYNVYYASADYNPLEPGYPSLLNDFAKIATTQTAFLMFYDEFPLAGNNPGFGGGFFNGAQELAFNKTALEDGLSPTDPRFNVAIENMGTIPTPDGTCDGSAGIDCWAAVIPAQAADSSQWDTGNGGSGFMMDSLDFNSFYGVPSSGDNRIAVWDWTGLDNLANRKCRGCDNVSFGGELFKGVDSYYDPSSSALPSGLIIPQKAGPIPLGDNCGKAGLSAGKHPTPRCPEGGLATNGDFMTQVSQAQGQLWGETTTQVNQNFGSSSEAHQGVAYWVVGTGSFDTNRTFTLTDQGYVSAAHEDLTMPGIAAGPSSGTPGIMVFTLTGNGGPTGADNGGFYPSTAYGRLTTSSSGLSNSTINVADLGQSPQDGFTEYQGYPGTTRPRWGDYTWPVFMPGSDRIYFANEYIQYPNCTGRAFNYNAIGTCGGTRDGLANWGTSVNYVTP